MDQGRTLDEQMQAWAALQKKLWERWIESMPEPNSKVAADAWGRAIDGTKVAMSGFFEAQLEWARMWATLMRAGAGQQEIDELTNEIVTLIERWSASQNELWETLFAAVRRLEPQLLATTWEDELWNVGQAWQDAARKVIEAQMSWNHVGLAAPPRNGWRKPPLLRPSLRVAEARLSGNGNRENDSA